MKHLLVTNDYPPKVGGIQNYLWEIYRRLPSDEFTIFTTPYEGAEEFDSHQNHEIRRHSRFWLSPTPDVRRRIDELTDETGSDLVVLDPALPLGALGPTLKSPYALVIHGTEAVVPAQVPALSRAYRRTVSGAEHVISSSEWATQATAKSLGGSAPPSTYVPPGVDTKRFVPLDTGERNAARTRFGLPDDVPVILSLSRLVPRKGMDRLIEAAAILRSGHPDLQVVIAGGGRDDARLRRLIRATGAPVRLLGRVDDCDLPALYGCADVFAMLCRNRWGGLEQEGFGIVFVEAAAAGIPQVAGQSGGAAEAVDHGRTGLVVQDPNDPAQVAVSLDRLLADPAMRTAFGHAARTRAVAQFSYDVLVDRYRDAVHGVQLGITERPVGK